MKKLISILIIGSLFLAGAHALAQSASLPDPGVTPDSPFYFLKTWKEQVQLFFTFNAEKKVQQFLHLADVRMAEYQKMLEKGKTEIAQKTLEKYQKQLDRALQKAEELKAKKDARKEKSDQIEKETSTTTPKIKELNERHIQILQKNLEKVPEAARESLRRALENSTKLKERIQEKLDKRSATDDMGRQQDQKQEGAKD